jgi:hypothetical protein
MRPIVIFALVCMASAAGADVGDDNARAARFFDEGRQAYERGDFNAARAGFEAARTLRPLPELDYDIARCWDQLGHADEAVAEYRRYLVAAPDGPNAGAVRLRIAALERNVAPPAAEAAHDRHRFIAPIAVGGAAVAAAVVGAALVGSVVPEFNRLKQQCQGNCVQPQWAGLEKRADAGYAMFGIAGALAIADGVLWLVAYRHAQRERAVAVAAPQPRAPEIEVDHAAALAAVPALEVRF